MRGLANETTHRLMRAGKCSRKSRYVGRARQSGAALIRHPLVVRAHVVQRTSFGRAKCGRVAFKHVDWLAMSPSVL
jgi:hypothetical protein